MHARENDKPATSCQEKPTPTIPMHQGTQAQITHQLYPPVIFTLPENILSPTYFEAPGCLLSLGLTRFSNPKCLQQQAHPGPATKIAEGWEVHHEQWSPPWLHSI